jgi:PST family polysaccharide transporter
MSPDTVAARSADAVVWAAFGAVAKVGGQLLVQITLARLLGPAAFGQLAAILLVVGVGAMLADCGFGAGLIQKKEISEQDIGLALGWSMLLGILAFAGVVFAAPLLATAFGDASLEPMLQACAVLGILLPPMNIALNLLRRDLDIRSVQIIHLVGYVLVYGGVAIALALSGWGAWSLVLGFMAQSVFTLAAAIAVLKYRLRPRWRGDFALLGFSLKALGSDLATWATENLDQIMIGRSWGVHALGLYTVAMNLCKAPTGLLNHVLQTIAFSSAARLQDHPATLRHGYLAVLAAVAMTTLPLFVLVASEAAVVLDVIYGPKWAEAAPLMTALALAMPMMATAAITAAVLRGTGFIGVEMRAQLVTGTVVFVGFAMLGSLPLATVVWVLPIAYGMKLAALLPTICRRFAFTAGELLVAVRGAVALALIGLAAAAAVRTSVEWSQLAGGALPLLAGIGAVLLAAGGRFAWFSGPALASVLRSRYASGPLGATVGWLARELP